jgi:hypothetical protein
MELPVAFGDFVEWFEHECGARATLMPRAVRELKDAVFEDVPLVAKCVQAISTEARAWLSGQPGGKAEFEEKCRELGVQFGKSISESRAGEEVEKYYVEYPRGSRKRVFLEWAIKKGSDKDERHCLRIYFFWDDESQRVVIGWLPSHLPNRFT